MEKIIIFGTEDVSQLAEFYLNKDSNYKPVAFCVNGEYIKESSLNKLPIVPFEEIEKTFTKEKNKFFAPLYENKIREKKYNEIKNKGYNFISYISSKATVWSDVGENCFIMEDNTIQPFVNLGNNVIMWSGNHIGHHSTIKDNVFFSSHVVLSGHCFVDRYCWLGVNSTIRDHITLSEGTFVAMSSMITKNTKPYKKYIGNPAKEYGNVAN